MEHIMLYCVLFLFITSISVPSFGKEHKLPKETEENEEEDLEWRILKKEETVPRGSHVQIDLTTGERRIRVVVDKSTKKPKTSVLVVNPEDKDQDKTYSQDLQQRLKHITGDDIVQTEAGEEPAKVKRRFKSYDELKKDFDDLHMAVKTDIEIMNGILESYKELVNSKVPSTEEIEEQQLTMLTDLEYLLHQIDNANEFVKTGGLAYVVLPSLNSSSPEVRSGTARLLGSAAQSNTAVQIAALESGTIGILLRILALDKTPSVRSSTLYALSCLVRRFPIAQKKLVDEGGLTVLNNLFNTDASDKLKIQVKVLTFIHDLIVEKQDAEKTFTLVSKETNSNFSVSSIEEAKERLRQYNLIGLETRLQEQLWCNQLSSLLIEHVSLHLDVILTDIGSKTSDSNADISVEHDIIEKIIRAMISSSNLCLSDYENNSKLQEVIRVLYLWYKKLSTAEENEGDTYFADIVNILEDFSWRYKIQLQENIKDEL